MLRLVHTYKADTKASNKHAQFKFDKILVLYYFFLGRWSTTALICNLHITLPEEE